MGFAKEHAEDVAARGFGDSDKTICDQHLHEQALKDVIVGVACEVSCSYCDRVGSEDDPIAASLEGLADHLDWDVRNWLNTERPAYRTEVLQASATFMKRTQRLSSMMNAAPTLTELQRETESLYKEWQAIYSYLSRCNTPDRPYLSQRARDISSDLKELDAQLRL